MVSDRAYLRLFQMDEQILTQSEIRRLLDDELTKDDPDTELIGYCLDALDEGKALPPTPVRIRFRWPKASGSICRRGVTAAAALPPWPLLPPPGWAGAKEAGSPASPPEIAPTGQTCWHRVQPVHRVSSMHALPSFRMTPGQPSSVMHLRQPTHFAASTRALAPLGRHFTMQG